MGIFLADGQADEAFAVIHHEIDIFRSAVLGSTDEIGFIFPFRVVGDHDDAAGLQFLNCFFNRIICLFFCIHQ